MREYELVVIMSPEVADEAFTDAVDRLIRRPVETRGGEVQEVNHWGRRKLAYPINRQMEGNYVITHLRLDPRENKVLELFLGIS